MGGLEIVHCLLTQAPNTQICQGIAILAGDALLSKSFEHIAKHTPKDIPAERVVEVLVRLGEVGWLVDIRM